MPSKKLWLGFAIWEVAAVIGALRVGMPRAVMGMSMSSEWFIVTSIVTFIIMTAFWWGVYFMITGFIDYAKKGK